MDEEKGLIDWSGNGSLTARLYAMTRPYVGIGPLLVSADKEPPEESAKEVTQSSEPWQKMDGWK